MRSLIVAFIVSLLACVSFSEELQRAKTLFTARTFKFIYSYEDRQLVFKDLSNKTIGIYPSKLRLNLLENSNEKQYNTVILHENSEVLITQWENGKFTNIRAFVPVAGPLPVSVDKPYCEVSVLGDAFDWRTDQERITIEKVNNQVQFKFLRNSGTVEICR
ncbi:MAG: hypothetical protein K2Q26_02170 [Bdellovibrionales bacterium]|nr:hypothetical protein [Bdellovibrionales bacterium]